MSDSKFELTSETKIVGVRTLHRIRALRDIPRWGVKSGDLGGWLESERNLAQSGGAWVSGDAWVYGGARVSGDAWVSGDARVSGDAQVYGDALVYGDAQVSGNAWVSGDAQVSEPSHVLTVGPVGSEGCTATLHRTITGHALHVGCWRNGTVDALPAEVERRAADWTGSDADMQRWRAEYQALIPLFRLRAASFHTEGETA